MNYLSKKRVNKLEIHVIINSFTGNPQESYPSEELLRILKMKNVNIISIIDINQELIFEKEKSKRD